MKTLLIVLVASFIFTSVYAKENFEIAMKEGLKSFSNIKSLDDFETISNQFERIALVETKEWLPLYYSSYCKIILTFKTQDLTKKTQLLDAAEKQIEQAMAISSKESELYTLQGMLCQATISLDPMNNGQIYSEKANAAFAEAIRLDENNPRPHYLKAISIMYTPAEYGGGKQAACPLFTSAIALFDSFTPESEIYPDWGRDDCNNYLANCSN